MIFKNRSKWPPNPLTLLVLSLLLATTMAAQTPSEVHDSIRQQQLLNDQFPIIAETGAIPGFYEDEIEDVGPQYLLLDQGSLHSWHFSLDSQWMHTDNPTLAEVNTEDASIGLFGINLGYRLKQFSREPQNLRSKIDLSVGTHYHLYRYGIFDRNQMINGLAIQSNDFDAFSAYTETGINLSPWRIAGGMRHSALYNTSSADPFYREWQPYLTVRRPFQINSRDQLLLHYEASCRFTESDSYGLLPDSWNDRWDSSLALVYHKPVSQKWSLQAQIISRYSDYVHKERSRQDLSFSSGLNLLYRPWNYCHMRAFINQEIRQSSEVAIPDYKHWDVGIATTLNWKF